MTLNRRELLALTTAGAALGLSACAAGSGPAVTGDAAKGVSKEAPLQFWSNHPGKSKAAEEAIIKEWNEKNPDTPVKLVTAGADYEELAQKFNAALAGGQLPDVIVASDVTWFNFALQDQTAALDDLWREHGINSDDFVDALREDYSLKGKHYGMPYSRSTCLMYLNKEHLAAAGLPTDRGPETWQEFAEWAPKLTAASGKPAMVLPDGTDYLDWYFQSMVWAFGGSYSKEWEVTFTNEKTLEAGQFLQDQVKAKNITIETDPNNSFALGNSSILLQSTGGLAGITEAAQFEFITAFLPGPGPSCPTGGAGIALVNNIADERKAAAVKFMDFLTNTDNTIKFTQATGYMPVRKSALDNPEEQKFLEANPNAATAIKQLSENTRSQDNARVFVPGGGERIGAALDRITLNGEDVKTAFQKLAEETQEIIDRDIKPEL